MIHPLYRRRFKDFQARGAGVRYRIQMRLIEWAGWSWGFIRG